MKTRMVPVTDIRPGMVTWHGLTVTEVRPADPELFKASGVAHVFIVTPTEKNPERGCYAKVTGYVEIRVEDAS